MSDKQPKAKKTYIWHYKPEEGTLKVFSTMNDFRAGAPDFKPGDGTRVFKGPELEFKTIQRVVMA